MGVGGRTNVRVGLVVQRGGRAQRAVKGWPEGHRWGGREGKRGGRVGLATSNDDVPHLLRFPRVCLLLGPSHSRADSSGYACLVRAHDRWDCGRGGMRRRRWRRAAGSGRRSATRRRSRSGAGRTSSSDSAPAQAAMKHKQASKHPSRGAPLRGCVLPLSGWPRLHTAASLNERCAPR